MREFETTLEARHVDVKIVTFDSVAMSKSYCQKFEISWPILIDPEMELYSAYGMTKASLWRLINPLRLLMYFRNMLRGAMPGKQGRDIYQLGGDIVIDPAGRIRLCHLSKHPHDRPSVRDLLDVLE